MLIACDFHWEMGHRIMQHPGLCRNVHGHSYFMRVSIEGALQSNGMVMDFIDLKNTVQPMVDALDHCFLCDEHDDVMKDFFSTQQMKVVYVPFASTAEHIAQYFLNRVRTAFETNHTLFSIAVRVQETDTSFAEAREQLRNGA